jgi:hypothetical protein
MYAATDAAKMARSVTRDNAGKLTGSEKNPTRQKAIEEGKKRGISERTMQRAIAEMRPSESSRKTKAAKPPKHSANTTANTVKMPDQIPVIAMNSAPPEALSKPLNDVPFEGDNSYAITFIVNGTRLSTVKKKILELFPECENGIEIETNYDKKSQADRLAEAHSILEKLRDEIEEWRDNLPGNLQSEETADQIDECIAILTVIGT